MIQKSFLKEKEKLFDYIIDISKFGIGICTVEEIDHLGIQEAVKVSMKKL